MKLLRRNKNSIVLGFENEIKAKLGRQIISERIKVDNLPFNVSQPFKYDDKGQPTDRDELSIYIDTPALIRKIELSILPDLEE